MLFRISRTLDRLRVATSSNPNDVAELKRKYKNQIATNTDSEYAFLKKNGITAVIYGHIHGTIAPVGGITFHTINRNGMAQS